LSPRPFNLRLVDVGSQECIAAHRLRTLSRCPAPSSLAKRLIREFQPNVVFGVGGYASGPAMAAALWLKVRQWLRAQRMPGLANRLVGKRVQAAAVNFPQLQVVPQRRGHRHSSASGVLHLAAPTAPTFDLRRLAGRAHLQCPPARIIVGYWRPFPPHVSTRAASATMSRPRQPTPSAAPILAAGSPALHRRHAARFAQAHSSSPAAELQPWPNLPPPASGPAGPFAAAADDHQRRNAEEMVKPEPPSCSTNRRSMRPVSCSTLSSICSPIPSGWPRWPRRLAPRPSAAAECIANRLATLAQSTADDLSQRGSVQRGAKSCPIHLGQIGIVPSLALRNTPGRLRRCRVSVYVRLQSGTKCGRSLLWC